LGGVFYSVKEKGYSSRERRVTEQEFSRRMEIEAQMASDRVRAAEMAKKEAEKDSTRRKQEGGVATFGIRSSVNKPPTPVGAKKNGGGGGSSIVKRPPTKRVGRGF
jgi:pre-mRNA-splicing factor ATP-dependent RNA helicase DHX38/PRP16